MIKTIINKPLKFNTHIYQWSHFSLVIQFPHILQVLQHKRRTRMMVVGVRDGNWEPSVVSLDWWWMETREGVVCLPLFNSRSQWYLPKLRIIPNNPEAEDICVIRTRYFYFLSINTYLQSDPKTFRIIILQADTSERSACRVMILKIRCFWTPCTKTLFQIITSKYTLYSRLYFTLWGEGSSIL